MRHFRRRVQPLHHHQVKKGREGHQGRHHREQQGQVNGEAPHQPVRCPVLHQGRRGGQQVDDGAFDGHGEAGDDAHSRQHHHLVGQAVDGRADDGTFGRHQQPTGEQGQPEPENVALSHTVIHEGGL